MKQTQNTLMPIVDAIESVAGIKIHRCTGSHWCHQGVKGVKLESKLLGGRRVTDEPSVTKFIDEVSAVQEIKAN